MNLSAKQTIISQTIIINGMIAIISFEAALKNG